MTDKDDSGLSVSAFNAQTGDPETTISSQSPPVVFQCSQCNSVVGDSTSWLSANKLMRTITLSFVTSKVGVRQSVEISKSGVDKDSTFQRIYCVNCGESLGMQYLAVSLPDMDCVRGNFTFLVEKLNSYEIGSAEMGGKNDLADLLSMPSARCMQEQIYRIEYLIRAMNGRLRALENVSGWSEAGVQNTSHVDSTCAQQGESEKDVEVTESVSSSENVADMNPRQQNQSLSSFHAAGMMNIPKQRSTSIRQKCLGKKLLNENMEGDGGEVMFDDDAFRVDKENQKDSQSQKFEEKRNKVQHRQKNKTVDEMVYVARRADVNSPRGCRLTQYSRKMPTNNKDDMTDVSVAGTSDAERNEFKKRGGSLMEQWPSPGSQNTRSYKKRKMTTDN